MLELRDDIHSSTRSLQSLGLVTDHAAHVYGGSGNDRGYCRGNSDGKRIFLECWELIILTILLLSVHHHAECNHFSDATEHWSVYWS